MNQLRMTLLSGAALTLLASVAASAQEAVPSAAPTAQPGGTEGDIIVTAQRRSESLERTPVAISVLSGDTLAKQAIVSERDLQIAAPGLTVRASQNENNLNYSLRGQTVDTFTSSLPAVLPYVNEVQVGGAGATAFYDLASIQVLKGPQGTLFGRNSTGGAVLFTTAKPTEEVSGYGSVRTGSFHDVQLEGAVGGAVIPDKLLVRVAGYYRTREGYQLNLYYNSKLGDLKREGARISITAKPTPDITNDLVAEYYHDDGTNVAASVYYVVPPSANVPGNPFVPVNLAIPGLVDFGAAQKARGPYVVDIDSLNGHHDTKWILSNITTANLTNNLKIKNVLGYVHTRAFDQADLDGTRYGIDGRGSAATGAPGSVGKIEQFSEEFQFLGKGFGQRLDYVAGVYYSDNKNDTHETSYILNELGAPPQINAGVTTSKSIAGYAQGTLDTGLAGFKLTAGVRYTSETIKFVRAVDDNYSPTAHPAFAPFYADGRFTSPQKDTFKKLSWTLGVQNQVTPDLLLYAASRRSFRSGGFNSNAPPTPGFANESGGEYRPEVATDVELGAKYRGNPGGLPVRFNLAVYNMWVTNVQRANYVAIYGGLAGITVNVPKAEITGFELDGSIRPATWLNIGGNLNYTDARFTSNQVLVLAPGGGTSTATYDTYPDTPKWSGVVYADVTVPVSNTYNGVLHGDAFRQTSTYFSSTGKSLNPGTQIPAYTVANFRAGIEPRGGKGLSASVLVKNAFNQTYYTGGIGFASLFAVNIVVPGEPRTFLGEIRYRF